jgi:acetyl-CoA carboxylase carboxyl transferase subunit beta
MSWLTRVRNSIPFLPKRETPDNLWHKCPECEAMVFTKEYEDNLFVCPRCDHHGRIGPTMRFDMLLDPG